MADELPTFQFEDVPLDEARRMGRGPRMEPMLYDTLRQKIRSLSSEAVRIHLGPEIRPERMKNYLLRIARELNVPITVRRVPAAAAATATGPPPRAPAEGKALSIHTPPSGALRREGDTPPSCIRLILLLVLLYINIWKVKSTQLKT